MAAKPLINTILESVLKEAMGLNTSSVGPSSIKHAIARRMRSLDMDNVLRYIKLIKSSSQELNELIEEVTVNETWFFRDEAPFVALREYATAFYSKHKGHPLKLLSIPCSTGEEPYSMAITLIEAGIPPYSFTIDAVDISRRSLAIAEEGFYRSHSFRGPNAEQYQDYFTKNRQGYVLDKNIKNLVRFHRGNLIHLGRPLTTTTYPVIFCRNLLIYLDISFHQQAINTFDTLLADDGLLFVGHAEAGIFTGNRFVPAPYPKAFAFRKNHRPNLPEQHPHPCLVPANWPSEEVPQLTTEPPPDKGFDKPPADDLNRGRQLAEQDKFEKEIMACEDLIRNNGPSAEAFYQLASLFEKKRDWQTAIKMLKKATYLDPNSIDAIDMLAAIYQRLGDEGNYQSCLKRGRRIITRLSRPTTE